MTTKFNLFLACAMAILPLLSFAQNWSPITEDEQFNYHIVDSIGINRTLNVDSISSLDIGTKYYLNRVVLPCADCCEGESAFLLNQNQFLGDSLLLDDNGFTIYGVHVLYFDLAAEVGESWDFTLEITATLTSEAESDVLGETNMVKTIALSTGEQILLSENHGIVSWDDPWEAYDFELVGIQERNLGERVPDFWDVFNFEVGDVFRHMRSSTYFGANDFRRVQNTILNKTVTENGFEYEVYSIINVGYSNGDPAFWVYEGTITNWIIQHDMPTAPCFRYEGKLDGKLNNQLMSEFSVEPLLEFPVLTTFADGRKLIDFYNGGLPGNYELGYYGQSSYLNQSNVICEGNSYEASRVGVRMGIVLSDVSHFKGGCTERLEGYVHDGDTIGDVFPESFLSIQENAMGGFQLYPNPVRSELTIVPTHFGAAKSIVIKDQLGRKLKTIIPEQNESTISIDVSDLPNGVYYITLDHRGARKFIKH